MTITRVLLPVAGPTPSAPQVDTALEAARALGAHLTGLYIDKDERPIPGYAMSAEFTTAMGQVGSPSDDRTARFAGHRAERRERAARQARSEFASACEAAGLTVASNGGTAPGTAGWKVVTGTPRSAIADHAGEGDLVIAASNAVTEAMREIAEAALLNAGCPVLLAPTRLQRPFTKDPMIAWDESPECWHAVEAALPFLSGAAHTHVVTVNKDRDAPRETLDKVVAYLRHRGVDADASVAQPLSRSVGAAILSEASEHGGGMLVMGAYSHSPLAEWIFGGATRHVLKNAAATPVLLAH